MPNLTSVTFPPEQRETLRKAIKFYGFENFNTFFRACAYSVIEHHGRRDTLVLPIQFTVTNNGESPPKAKRK